MARDVVASARLAQPEWEALGPERRCEILGMLADVMESGASELRAALEHDIGRSDMDVRVSVSTRMCVNLVWYLGFPKISSFIAI